MFGLGVPELLIIAAVLLLLFGAKRLPVIGESLAQFIVRFVKSVRGDDDGGTEPRKLAANNTEREENTPREDVEVPGKADDGPNGRADP